MDTQINITSGEILNEMLGERYPDKVFIPFNEAMITGTYTAPLFSDEFILERSAVHNVTPVEYRSKLSGFLELLAGLQKYSSIVLWFGDEPFCRKNRNTVIKALRMYGYKGRLELNIVDEETCSIIEHKMI